MNEYLSKTAAQMARFPQGCMFEVLVLTRTPGIIELGATMIDGDEYKGVLARWNIVTAVLAPKLDSKH